MKRSILVFLLIIFCSGFVTAQDISILKGWKFKTGDDPAWSSENFNDSAWASIEISKHWKSQGYPYDGFAWYRLHVFIPSSIKEKALHKEQLRIDLGKIEDGDETFLNGSLIGTNAGVSTDVKKGPGGRQRSYLIPLTDDRIHWDRDNLIAVRVWDNGVDGGLYDGKYGVSVVDITDDVIINTQDDFIFGPGKKISKKVIFQSSGADFTGQLQVSITDPFSGQTIYKTSQQAAFSKSKPYTLSYNVVTPKNISYQVSYDFKESKTGKIVSASEGTPYILTPASPQAPKINGPSVFGVRPEAPFQYTIPATGIKPITYAVKNLPAGLNLDSKTGQIGGRLGKKGNYPVTFVVTNRLGHAEKSFTIICGETIGLTPAMGWNSWNCWGNSVSDEKVRAAAKAMSEKLAGFGWTYVNIDDGWPGKRDKAGNIQSNEKFPDMYALANYIHGLGLKLGIYSSPGPETCGGFTGSYQHDVQDAKRYAQWGVDYFKFDWCSYDNLAPFPQSIEQLQTPYRLMRAALDSVNRDIIFSLCQYGGNVWQWGKKLGGNSWRTMGDITDSWQSMSGIGFSQNICSDYAEPGHFNDPDMLVIGRVGWGPAIRKTRLSPVEQYTHISLWSLLSAPLLIGSDISKMDSFTLNLLTNSEVLAIDQDALGMQAHRVIKNDSCQVWIKNLEDGSKAVGIFNLSDHATKNKVDFSTLGLSRKLKLRDVWTQKYLPGSGSEWSFDIPSHGVVLLKIEKQQ